MICVLQDLPVALLLGQRLAVSELAKSKAKAPVGAAVAAPLLLALVIVSFIWFALCTLPWSMFYYLGICVQCNHFWVQIYLYLVIYVGSFNRKEILERGLPVSYRSSLPSRGFSPYCPRRAVVEEAVGSCQGTCAPISFFL